MYFEFLVYIEADVGRIWDYLYIACEEYKILIEENIVQTKEVIEERNRG